MVKFLAFLIILVILFGLDTTRSIIGGAFWVIVIIAIVGAIWAFINAVSPKKEDGKKDYSWIAFVILGIVILYSLICKCQ